MLNFVIDNIFGQLGGLVFQHMIGIPMVTNWAPLIAVVFLQASSFELGRLTGCNHPSQRSICRTPYGIDAHHTHCFIKKTYTAHGWFIERGATNESVCMTNAGLSTINNPACQMLTTPPRTVCYDCCQQMNCDRDSLYCNNYDHIDTKYMPSFMKTGPHSTVITKTTGQELGRLTGCNHPSQRSICRTPYGIDAHHTHCFIKKTYTAHGWFIERGATNESVCMTNAGLSTINNPACQMLTTPPRTVCYDCCQQMNCDRDSLYCNNYDHIDTKYMPSFMKTGPHSTVITKTTGQELGRLTGCNHPSQRSICRTPYGIDAHHTHCFIKKTYTAHGWFIERGATNESVCMTNAGLSTINNPACQMLTTPPRTVCYDCCQQMNCDRDSLYCNNYDHIDTKYMPSFMKTGPHSTVITKTTGQG